MPGATSDSLSEAAAVDVKRLAEAIQTARRNARLVLVSIHAHDSYRTLDAPARFLQPLARACIDAGADAFFGAGPHVTWGIELYKAKPICYSLGDFVFQYETVRGYAADTYEAFKLDPQTPDPSLASDRITLPHDPAIWGKRPADDDVRRIGPAADGPASGGERHVATAVRTRHPIARDRRDGGADHEPDDRSVEIVRHVDFLRTGPRYRPRLNASIAAFSAPY